MQGKELESAFRRGWVLIGISLLFVALFAFFTFVTHEPDPEVTWDMGGKPFVPASGVEADGYYAPVKGWGAGALKQAPGGGGIAEGADPKGAAGEGGSAVGAASAAGEAEAAEPAGEEVAP